MLAWVVIDRMYSRQFLPKSSSLRTLCLCIEFSDSLRPTSVVPTPLQSVRYALFLSRRRVHTPSGAALTTAILSNAYPCSLYPLFFNLVRTLCTFLHSPKTQLFYFQPIPHSASKNTITGGGERGTSAIHKFLRCSCKFSAAKVANSLSAPRPATHESPVTSHQSL